MKNKKIVLIEDEEVLAKILRKEFVNAGFKMVLRRDGVSGLAAIRKEKPDLVLLDLLLPGESGMDLLEELKKSPVIGDIPVCILTALSAEDDVRRGIALGAVDYIIKSQYSVAEILAKVKKLLANEDLLFRSRKKRVCRKCLGFCD